MPNTFCPVTAVQSASSCGCCLDYMMYPRGESSNIMSTVFLDWASLKTNRQGCNIRFTTDKRNDWYTFSMYQFLKAGWRCMK
jgi:hypothetical protein